MSFPRHALPSARPFLAFPALGYVFSLASSTAGQTFSCFSNLRVCLFPGKLPSRADLFLLFPPQGMSFPRQTPQPGRPFLAFQASGYVFSQACSPTGQTFSCFFNSKVCLFPGKLSRRADLFLLFPPQGMSKHPQSSKPYTLRPATAVIRLPHYTISTIFLQGNCS